MSDNTTEIKFGGDASGAIDAANKSAEAVKKSTNEMRAALESLTRQFSDANQNINHSFEQVAGVFEKFRAISIGVTAALAGGKMFKEVIASSVEWNKEVGKLSKTLGITTEEASVLSVALDHIGVSSESYTHAAMAMTRQLTNNAGAFTTLGVATRDASGQLRPTSAIMGDVNSKLREINNGTLLNQAGMQVYGRSWNEVRGVLKLTTSQIREAEELAKRLHLIVGPEGVAMTRQYEESQRDLSLIFKSLEIQVGSKLLPTMTEFGKFLGDEGPSMAELFAGAIAGVSEGLAMLWLTTQKAGLGVAYLSNQIAAAASRDWGAMSRLAQGYGRDLDAIDEKYRKLHAEMQNPHKAESTPKGKRSKSDYDFNKNSAGDTRFQEWKSQLEAKKESENKFFKSSLEEEENFWQQKLALVRGNSKAEIQLRRQIQHELYQIHKEQAVEERATEDERIVAKRKASASELEMAKETLRLKKALGDISDVEELQAEGQLLAAKQQNDLEALNQKLALYADDKKARQRVLDEIEQLEQQHALNVKKIGNDIAIARKQEAQNMLAPITQAIDTSIQGMIMGTTTAQKAMQNIFQSIAAEFVNATVKKMLNDFIAGELAKTTAFQSFSAIRQALMGAETAVATTEKGAEATAVVGANAAEAASGAAASQASIPYIGPVLAAAAFAATMGLVLGARSQIKASAAGGFDIPAGLNPVTQLHQEEMVLPASIAKPLRKLLHGGGLDALGEHQSTVGNGVQKGGDTYNFNLNAIDAKSSAAFIRANGSELAREMRRQALNFAPNKA